MEQYCLIAIVILKGRRNEKRTGWTEFKKDNFKTTKGQLFCFLGRADGLWLSAPLSIVTYITILFSIYCFDYCSKEIHFSFYYLILRLTTLKLRSA